MARSLFIKSAIQLTIELNRFGVQYLIRNLSKILLTCLPMNNQYTIYKLGICEGIKNCGLSDSF